MASELFEGEAYMP